MGLDFGYKIALVLLVVGCVLQLISVASPYWVDTGDIVDESSKFTSNLHFGLWRACVTSKAGSIELFSHCDSTGTAQDWLTGTKALAVLGLLHGVFGLSILLTKTISGSKSRVLCGLTLMATTLAALFTLIGIGIFATKIKDFHTESGESRLETDYLSWSWYLGLFGALSFVISVVMLVRSVVSDRENYNNLP